MVKSRALLSYFLLFTGMLAFSISCTRPSQGAAAPPNILFIAVDDLRPELGCYGAGHIRSPHIDRLAATARQFDRAYCQVPICGASRASLLTGTYPTRYRFLSARTRADVDRPGVSSLPGHLKKHGYYTISNGKVFDRPDDHLEAWSEPPFRFQGKVRWTDYHDPENIRLDSLHRLGRPWERMDLPDTAYFDGHIAGKTIEDLKKLKNTGQPFFLAAGFLKPHLPFTAPARYWDYYDPEQIRLPRHQAYHPADAPEQAFRSWTELLAYYGVPEGPLPDSLARRLIHGYYACVSYADAQIGRVLQALEDLELAKNTVVVLWGDHGWHLGEHGLWCKKYNFQEALRVPLLIRAPGMAGGRTQAVAELVDLYPTLCELAGIPLPEHLVGQSLVPQLQNPADPGTGYAFAKWEDGLSLLTDRYAYTEWLPTPDSMAARMLYDLVADPAEMRNLAENREYRSIVDSLHRRLEAVRGPDFEQPIE